MLKERKFGGTPQGLERGWVRVDMIKMLCIPVYHSQRRLKNYIGEVIVHRASNSGLESMTAGSPNFKSLRYSITPAESAVQRG